MAPTHNVAIIFGVTGLVGRELAKRLIGQSNWKVYGIARRFYFDPYLVHNSNYRFVSCDLLDREETETKLCVLRDVTHLFWVTWASQYPLDSKACCEQNAAMMSNALSAVLPNAKNLQHVSLQTGMKHYVSLRGPFGSREVEVFDEDCPRARDCYNFYYVFEDLLKERLPETVSWSVLRPGLIMGSSSRTLYNVIGSLCIYGAICKHLNMPFVFGGTRECWKEVCIDGSDARLVAEQHIWVSTNGEISSQDGSAFNSINGGSFTWKEIWPILANKFEVEVPKHMFSYDFRYAKEMTDKKEIWRDIVSKGGLVKTEMEDLANWEFLDILFRCPMKLLGSRQKSDKLGFTMRCKTLDSILYWIDEMRSEVLIP